MDFAKAVVIYLSTIVFFVLVVDCKSKDLLVSVFVGGRRYRPGFRSRWQCFFFFFFLLPYQVPTQLSNIAPQ